MKRKQNKLSPTKLWTMASVRLFLLYYRLKFFIPVLKIFFSWKEALNYLYFRLYLSNQMDLRVRWAGFQNLPLSVFRTKKNDSKRIKIHISYIVWHKIKPSGVTVLYSSRCPVLYSIETCFFLPLVSWLRKIINYLENTFYVTMWIRFLF